MVLESHPLVFCLINYLKKAEALASKDISDIEHGLEEEKNNIRKNNATQDKLGTLKSLVLYWS